jgi:hypothetical protein
MLPIRHPEHAIRHRTILHASRRPRAPSTHLVDHRHNMRLAFPFGSRPLGNRLILLNLAIHITRHCRGIFSHGRSIEPPNSPTFSTPRAGKSTESRCSAIRPENRRCRFSGSAHHRNTPYFHSSRGKTRYCATPFPNDQSSRLSSTKLMTTSCGRSPGFSRSSATTRA